MCDITISLDKLQQEEIDSGDIEEKMFEYNKFPKDDEVMITWASFNYDKFYAPTDRWDSANYQETEWEIFEREG